MSSSSSTSQKSTRTIDWARTVVDLACPPISPGPSSLTAETYYTDGERPVAGATASCLRLSDVDEIPQVACLRGPVSPSSSKALKVDLQERWCVGGPTLDFAGGFLRKCLDSS
jgi:hypothetical protein